MTLIHGQKQKELLKTVVHIESQTVKVEALIKDFVSDNEGINKK